MCSETHCAPQLTAQRGGNVEGISGQDILNNRGFVRLSIINPNSEFSRLRYFGGPNFLSKEVEPTGETF